MFPRKVGERGKVKVDETNDLRVYKKSEKREMEGKRKEEQMQGQ